MSLRLLKEKPVLGWALYDWANSAFALTVVATFFPIFFRDFYSAGEDSAAITSRFSIGISTASLVVALLAPILGAVADSGGTRKRFLLGFTLLAVASVLGLYFVEQGDWVVALGLYACALLGFYAANTFYDSLLVTVTTPDRYEQVSALGFGIGYFGSALLLALNTWMVSKPEVFGFADVTAAMRAAFAIVAVWWAVFTVPLLVFVKEPKNDSPGLMRAAVDGYRTLVQTLRDIRQYRNIALFLAAYWLYIDGVHTLILMATDFGARLEFDRNDLIAAILITNFVGAPATIAFGLMGERIGPKRAIIIGIFVYLLIAAWGLTLKEVWQFYAMAIGIGLVQGGVQSMSRAMFARLIPDDKASEFFGFYSTLGKFAAILGPLLIGILSRVSDDPRIAVVAVLPLFIGGLLLLVRVSDTSETAAPATSNPE
ncbi:MAG: MFS transporter [Pseudomonadota bacterium]